jgi:hypothetical protein
MKAADAYRDGVEISRFYPLTPDRPVSSQRALSHVNVTLIKTKSLKAALIVAAEAKPP